MTLGLLALGAVLAFGCPGEIAERAHRKSIIAKVSGQPVRERLQAYVDQWPLRRTLIDNEGFSSQRQKRRDPLYLSVDSVVLKEVTEKILGSFEGATAASILFHEHLLIQIKKDPALAPLLSRNQHQTAKVLTLGFTKDSPLIRAQIDRAFDSAMVEFTSDLADLGISAELIGPTAKVFLKDPGKWFLDGKGKTVDMSYLDARARRRTADRSNTAQVQQQAVDGLPKLHQEMIDALGPESRLLIKPRRGSELVPTLRVLRVLRRVEATDFDTYCKAVNRSLGTNLSNDQILALRNYYREVADLFVTNVYPKYWDPVRLRPHRHGVYAFDLEGIGAENVQAVMDRLATGKPSSPEQAAQLASEGVAQVTHRLDATLDGLAALLVKKDDDAPDPVFGGVPRFVGDEGYIYPEPHDDSVPLTKAERREFFRRMTASTDINPRLGSTRIVYVSPKRAGVELRGPEIDFFVKEAQSLQKTLKENLLIHPDSKVAAAGDTLGLPIEVEAHADHVKLTMSLPKTLDATVRQQIENSLNAEFATWGSTRSGESYRLSFDTF